MAKKKEEKTRTSATASLNSVEDKDIVDKLATVPNVSDYIKSLIRADIKEGSNFTKAQKEEILSMIKDFLKDKEVIEKVEKVDQDIMNAIGQFDNL